MQQLHEYITFPCKYKEKGCTAVCPGSKIVSHQEQCFVNWQLCPFNYIGFCTWRGPKHMIVRHCKKIHRESSCQGSRMILRHRFLGAKHDARGSNYLVFFKNEVFVYNANVESNSKRMMVSMYYLGSKAEGANYTFTVTLTCISWPNGQYVTSTAPCGCVNDLINNNAIVQIPCNNIPDDNDYVICMIGLKFNQ